MKHVLFPARKVCLLTLGLLLAAPTLAQSPRLYSTRQGLVNTRISDLMFDRENFLWIPTDLGLARFNGHNFTTYLEDKESEYALHTNRISYIYEDPNHRHWVGAADGLYYFCRTENKFTHYGLSQDSTLVSVSCIISHPDRQNLLLVASFGYGIFAFDTESRTVDRDISGRLSGQLRRWNIAKLLVDNDRHLWALQQEGVACLSLGEPETISIEMDARTAETVAHTRFNDIVEDRANRRVYLGSAQGGLYCCDLQTMRLAAVDCPRLAALCITALQTPSEGGILIGTENDGLYHYDPATGEARQVHVAHCPCDLEHSKIHSIAYDEQGDLWLGLYQKGVLVIPAHQNGFTYTPVAATAGGYNLGNVSCFAAQADGGRIIGIDGGGLLAVTPDGTRRHYSTKNSTLQTNSVVALADDGAGSTYIGTYSHGVYLMRDGVVSLPASLAALSRCRPMCMAYDAPSHTLFVGTNGKGVYLYDTKTGQSRPFAPGKYNVWVCAVYMDMARHLWLGTEDGLFCADVEADSVWRTPEAVFHSRAIGFAESTASLWIATEQGLLRRDKADGTFTCIKNHGARPGETMTALVRGGDGLLWFTTNFGLGSYDPETGLFRSYSADELVSVGSFSTKAAYAWPDGSLSFGGDNGMIEFRPQAVTEAGRAVKEVFFTRLWVNNVPVDYDPAASDNVLDASLWHAKTLTLSPDASSFSISFAVQEYCDPLGIQYAYRLAGYEEAWHEVQGGDPSANYSNLPWGTYYFQVRAYTDDDRATSSFKQLCVIVVTPWYARWWAILIYCLLALAAAWVIIAHLRERTHQKRLTLRAEHAQQIKEAKLRLFTSISHEIKTPLTLILAPLRKLMDKRVDNATSKAYELMYRNALRILMLVNQLMDIRKIDHGQLRLHVRELSLAAFLGDIMKYFDQVAINHQVRYTLTMPDGREDLAVWGDPNQLDKVFFNLLSNAFKFTPDHGTVSIHVSVEDPVPAGSSTDSGKVIIRVYNSGSSLSTGDLGHIFERFYQGHNTTESAGTGIGLNLAHELAELHHGHLSASNVEDGGVVFVVVLPLGNAHFAAAELAPVSTASDVATIQADMVADKAALRKAKTEEFPPAATPDPIEEHHAVTVMVVDDDKMFLDYIVSELQDYNIVTATGGNEAWGQLLVSAPDVVITDIKMPDGDGYEFCQRIKQNIDTDNIPVIVLTSENTTDSEEEAMRCEADRFLPKPVNIALLRGAIEQSLKVRRNILSKMRRTDTGFSYDQVQMTSADTKLMQNVMECIRKNLADSEFSVEKLAREVGISRVHLNRKLKELINTAPSTLIRSVRLKQAAFLLIEDGVTVAEIAYSVGFSSPSYFTSNFTAYFGMTPKAFIANYQKNPDDEKLRKLLE